MEAYFSLMSIRDDKIINKNCELIDDAVQNHEMFHIDFAFVLDSYVKKVNNLLSVGRTRDQGLQILLALVPQCPQKVMAVQGEKWFQYCSKTVNSVCGAASKVIACQIIMIILKDLPYIPDLQTCILSKHPNRLVVSLAAADYHWSCTGLQCLYEYLKLSRGRCLPLKTELEKYSLRYLDNPPTRVGKSDSVSWAGRVFAAVPLPGMGGSGAEGRAEARGRQLTQLLALSHSLMDFLFDGIVEEESYEHTREHTLRLRTINALLESSINPIKSYLAVVIRLVNSLKFIAEMITSDVNTTITFVPYNLLGAMFRLLQMQVTKLQSYHSQEHQLLTFFMPTLHQHCLLVLRDAVISIGESIDMYFGVITGLLLSTVESYVVDSHEWCTSGLQTRIIAYYVMASIIQVSHGKHAPPIKFIELILQDVVPRNQEVKLQNKQDERLSSNSNQKKRSKKDYTGAGIGKVSSSQTRPTHCPEYFSCAARVALSLVKTLFTYATHSLTEKSQQLIQTSLMNVTSTVIGAARLPDIYMDGRTRAELYKTLASVVTHPHSAFPPAYTMIMHLLQSGLHDPDILVVSACQAALGNLSFIIANPQICIVTRVQRQRAQFNNDNDGGSNNELIDATQEERIQAILTRKEDEMNVMNGKEIDEEEEERGEENEKGEHELEKEVEEEQEEEEEKQEGGEEEKKQEGGEEEKEKQEGGEEEHEEEEEKQEEEQEGEKEKQQRETGTILEKDEEEITEDSNQFHARERDEEVKLHHASGNEHRKKRQRGLTTPVKIITEEKNELSCEKTKEQKRGLTTQVKRTAEEKNELSCKKAKKENEESNGGPSLEEMLASFVDCGPDV
ncbi:uncharacterized protein [Panulirus ornatus]|uniref:uncharacterized protein n=1 Tax=Panulirus ornatus TaxID=150431 RepID=UPI003A8963C5